MIIIFNKLNNTIPIYRKLSNSSKTSPYKQMFVVRYVNISDMLGFKVVCFVSEIQSKRQERKRRSTANPAYSGLFEPEVCTFVRRWHIILLNVTQHHL